MAGMICQALVDGVRRRHADPSRRGVRVLDLGELVAAGGGNPRVVPGQVWGQVPGGEGGHDPVHLVVCLDRSKAHIITSLANNIILDLGPCPSIWPQTLTD